MGEQELDLSLPSAPIDNVIKPIARFLHVEAASGIVLVLATIIALVLANSPVSESFLHFWHLPIGIQIGSFEFHHDLHFVINDGLMAIFFFVVGLEVKRELVLGELRDLRRASLPIAAALGGMLVPAGIYLLFQSGKPTASGWGIPMATDIAFVVGCMAVLGPRVPYGLRIVMLSLAIADDIGAILVIAVGYTQGFSLGWLALAAVALGIILLLGKLGVRSFSVYVVVGVFAWYAFHESGIHATLAGVILGLMTPARSVLSETAVSRLFDRAIAIIEGESWARDAHRAARVRDFQSIAREVVSPLEYLINALHPWVSFVIMPVFALANAGVPIHLSEVGSSLSLAIILALFIGKPVGIVVASAIAVKSGIARLPEGVSWRMLAGGGMLAGIGFTMALFIAGLALEGSALDTAKVGVLLGSLVSAIVGMILLYLSAGEKPPI